MQSIFFLVQTSIGWSLVRLYCSTVFILIQYLCFACSRAINRILFASPVSFLFSVTNCLCIESVDCAILFVFLPAFFLPFLLPRHNYISKADALKSTILNNDAIPYVCLTQYVCVCLLLLVLFFCFFLFLLVFFWSKSSRIKGAIHLFNRKHCECLHSSVGLY